MPLNRLVAAAALVVIVAAAAGLGGWHFLIRGDEPPPVNLEDAVAAAGTATEGNGVSGAGSTDARVIRDLSVTWTVDPSNEQTFLGYRIEEELANIGSATAVGALQTWRARSSSMARRSQPMRSRRISARSRATTTAATANSSGRRSKATQFPEATFVLAEPITLAGDPASGEDIAATAVGDLTIHGVTQRVELELQGRLVGEQVVVVGSTVIRLADYDIESPNSMMVLSVSDEATVEMQLVFTRA